MISKEVVDNCKKEGRWSELGGLFWNCFMFQDGKKREDAKKLWGGLSKREQKLCEGM